MKYICSSCKTIYNKKDLCIDSMGYDFSCPKCGRLSSGVFTEKELLEKINNYKELYESLHS